MATSITYPVLAQQQPYCLTSDVFALIGQVGAMQDGTVTYAQIQAAINAATRKIEQQTNNFFSPRRINRLYDGNGKTRMVLPNGPIINLNALNVYMIYPLAISQIYNDYDLLIDRQAGVISFPTFTDAPFFSGLGNRFLMGSRNIQIDAWHGYTREIYSDVLATMDNLTYAFSFPNAVKNATTVNNINDITPPTFFPIIYLNGVPLVNTTYTLQNQPYTTASVNNTWNIVQDNIYYALNDSGNGYSGVTFNQALPAGSVVTADYSYIIIPEDIAEICAKLAAITILGSVATGGGFSDTIYQGAVEVFSEGSRTRFNDTLGKWGHQITLWQGEIAQVIASRRKLIAQYGIGYMESGVL